MAQNWVDAITIEKSLRETADRIAAGLGHRMAAWAAVSTQRSVARCSLCSESATIAVRQFSTAPIAGVAVQLRCRPTTA